MTLIDRLRRLASLWAERSGRSVATLSTRVVKDGKFFTRIETGSANADTCEKFFAFFRDPASWPDEAVPAEVRELLDGVDLGIIRDHDAADTIPPGPLSAGKSQDFTAAQVPA